MARKTLRVAMPADSGRDAGKVFIITELPARQAHSWATRTLFGLLNAGVEVPDNLLGAGMAAIAAMGLKALAKLPAHVAEPLLNELLLCVAIQPGTDAAVTRGLIDDDTEEVATIFKLQWEALSLHINFSLTESPQTSG